MNFIVQKPFSYGKESIFSFQKNPSWSVYSFLGNTHIPAVSQAHLDFPVVSARGEALRPKHHGTVKSPKVIRRGACCSEVLQTFPRFSHHKALAGSGRVKGDWFLKEKRHMVSYIYIYILIVILSFYILESKLNINLWTHLYIASSWSVLRGKNITVRQTLSVKHVWCFKSHTCTVRFASPN